MSKSYTAISFRHVYVTTGKYNSRTFHRNKCRLIFVDIRHLQLEHNVTCELAKQLDPFATFRHRARCDRYTYISFRLAPTASRKFTDDSFVVNMWGSGSVPPPTCGINVTQDTYLTSADSNTHIWVQTTGQTHLFANVHKYMPVKRMPLAVTSYQFSRNS